MSAQAKWARLAVSDDSLAALLAMGFTASEVTPLHDHVQAHQKHDCQERLHIDVATLCRPGLPQHASLDTALQAATTAPSLYRRREHDHQDRGLPTLHRPTGRCGSAAATSAPRPLLCCGSASRRPSERPPTAGSAPSAKVRSCVTPLCRHLLLLRTKPWESAAAKFSTARHPPSWCSSVLCAC